MSTLRPHSPACGERVAQELVGGHHEEKPIKIELKRQLK